MQQRAASKLPFAGLASPEGVAMSAVRNVLSFGNQPLQLEQTVEQPATEAMAVLRHGTDHESSPSRSRQSRKPNPTGGATRRSVGDAQNLVVSD